MTCLIFFFINYKQEGPEDVTAGYLILKTFCEVFPYEFSEPIDVNLCFFSNMLNLYW